MNQIYDYIETGFRIFGLHGVTPQGKCECGNDECEALFKHPRISNWQNVPQWSDDQIEYFNQAGHFRTGFGVLCEGFLVVDVDARNGGVASFERLCADIPELEEAGFVVNTGSGNGSQHHYYRMEEPVAMVQNLAKYPGVDVKTTGYVVGSGSMHKSGNEYETLRGFPQDVYAPPAALIELFRKPERFRVSVEGKHLDVSEAEIAELLSFIDPNVSYEPWIKIGMSIHHCLQGNGFDMWDDWSRRGAKYPGAEKLEKHWHSFGKSPNPAGYGTILHYAREGGYIEPVTFEYMPEDDAATEAQGPALPPTGSIDLLRPPGFVGRLTEWINGQCLYPRENLAVAAALTAVSGLAGMRFTDEMDDMSANIISFCVAGSGTGKEALQQAYLKIMRTAGVQAAVHGGFKSEQELMRNLIRHQAAFYSVDELGLVLRKLDNAGKRGGAAYLEGIVGTIMSVYSKSNGFLPVTGDMKEEIREAFLRDKSRLEKRLDDLPKDSSSSDQKARLEAERDRMDEALKKIDDGLDSPYLTILGYTTPVTFNDLMSFEQATNGFMARSMIFNELSTNPKRKKGFQKMPMSMGLESSIQNLYAPGSFSSDISGFRVEYRGEKTTLPTSDEARALLDQVYEHFHAKADEQTGATGLEAIPRRGYELVSKVSLLLAIPEGLRTAEHVRWAFALAERDVNLKIQMAYSTENKDTSNGLVARVLSLLGDDHEEKESVICNRMRGTPRAQITAIIDEMAAKRMVEVILPPGSGRGRPPARLIKIIKR